MLAVKSGTGSYFNPENLISAYDEILSFKKGVESIISELGLFSEFMKEFRDLITIFRKRVDLAEEIIRKIDARLFNKIVYFGESLGETGDDVIMIEEKISGKITDRDHVITAFVRIVNSELKSGHSA